MNSFNVMILAAGYGKRMKNLTYSKPKPLLKIKNKELLRHNIDFFIDLGCKKIVINTHYLHEKIKYFIEQHYSNIDIKLTYEPTLLNTGGGIKNALNFLGHKNFLVANADIMLQEENKKDVKNFINKIQEIKTCKLLLAKDINFRGLKKSSGDFKLEDKLIKRWEKKDPHLYYTGLQIINPHIFKLVKDKSFSLNKLWDLLIANKDLQGQILDSNIVHVGDINAFNKFKYK
ncbi:MAG: nucleotidyl transferase [Pelagibacteraceae bacterium]|nr:nucleotidyl transferase [Pelagibacteraceae bacterium]|tara:strand:+ start:1520 stop:2212 length:693 start_codon:yes stop_codon:yes gene_type:complete